MELDTATLDELMYEYATITKQPVTPIMLHTQEALSMGHTEEKVKDMYKTLLRREPYYQQTSGKVGTTK